MLQFLGSIQHQCGNGILSRLSLLQTHQATGAVAVGIAGFLTLWWQAFMLDSPECSHDNHTHLGYSIHYLATGYHHLLETPCVDGSPAPWTLGLFHIVSLCVATMGAAGAGLILLSGVLDPGIVEGAIEGRQTKPSNPAVPTSECMPFSSRALKSLPRGKAADIERCLSSAWSDGAGSSSIVEPARHIFATVRDTEDAQFSHQGPENSTEAPESRRKLAMQLDWSTVPYNVPEVLRGLVLFDPTRPDVLLIGEHKFCRTCRIWRPPRAAHDTGLDVCVLQHDHYCTLIGNSVGLYNHPVFAAAAVCSTVGTGIGAILLALHAMYGAMAAVQIAGGPSLLMSPSWVVSVFGVTCALFGRPMLLVLRPAMLRLLSLCGYVLIAVACVLGMALRVCGVPVLPLLGARVNEQQAILAAPAPRDMDGGRGADVHVSSSGPMIRSNGATVPVIEDPPVVARQFSEEQPRKRREGGRSVRQRVPPDGWLALVREKVAEYTDPAAFARSVRGARIGLVQAVRRMPRGIVRVGAVGLAFMAVVIVYLLGTTSGWNVLSTIRRSGGQVLGALSSDLRSVGVLQQSRIVMLPQGADPVAVTAEYVLWRHETAYEMRGRQGLSYFPPLLEPWMMLHGEGEQVGPSRMHHDSADSGAALSVPLVLDAAEIASLHNANASRHAWTLESIGTRALNATDPYSTAHLLRAPRGGAQLIAWHLQSWVTSSWRLALVAVGIAAMPFMAIAAAKRIASSCESCGRPAEADIMLSIARRKMGLSVQSTATRGIASLTSPWPKTVSTPAGYIEAMAAIAGILFGTHLLFPRLACFDLDGVRGLTRCSQLDSGWASIVLLAMVGACASAAPYAITHPCMVMRGQVTRDLRSE